MSNSTSSVTLLEKGIELPLNADTAYFNYFWLRDNCSTSWDETTQERIFDILQEPDDLRALSAHIDNEQLEVTWHNGHKSRYALSWLQRWHQRENKRGHDDLAVRSRKPWYADHYSQLTCFDYEDLSNNPARVADWAEVLLDEGIALVKGMPDSNEGLVSLCELLGHVRPSFSGYAFDVQYKHMPENLAYTSHALELHTDLPSEELAPGVQFLHCRINEAEGGENLFVDAVAVANALKERYPAYFALLTQYKVPFRYTTDSQDIRAKQYIIELDPNNGEVKGVNFSQHLSDVFDLPQHMMDDFYPAFRAFGLMMLDEQYLMRFRLNTGECIVFDNQRVAHGRTSFTVGSGRRHLRGCYLDRGELRSTYRILRAKYPKS